MLRLLYVGLVRPHPCVIWNPYQLGDMRAIENVQRRATRTRLTSGMKQLCYHDCLATLNLYLVYFIVGEEWTL